MIFASPAFLYFFLPITILLYHLITPFRSFILIISSILFYICGEENFYPLLYCILLIYFFGLWLTKAKNKKIKKIIYTTSIVLSLIPLIYYKYTTFILDIFFHITGKNSHFPKTTLPLGVSFFTFQAIAYLYDVYHQKHLAEKNFKNILLFKSFFPQLLAGPIVRYEEIIYSIRQPKISILWMSQGMQLFIFGLSKKVLLANTFGEYADKIFQTDTQSLSILIAWLGTLLYGLQIFFDFSGYSEMAIGMGMIFGLTIPQNFNHPYTAKSIQDFWRRWHMTLSSWFRDYLYIPLGGSKAGKFKTYRNLLIVFIVTGLWHGANYNFLLWGLFHGLFLIFERLGFGNVLIKMPTILRHIYVLVLVAISWAIFRIENMNHLKLFLYKMFQLTEINIDDLHELKTFMDRQLVFCLLIGIFLAANGIKNLTEVLKINQEHAPFEITRKITSFILLLLCSIFVAGGTYNPFIYFRF